MKIIAAAMRHNKLVLSRTAPARHHDILHEMHTAGCNPFEWEQGFLTADGHFASREEAAEIAFKAGQIDRRKMFLFTEDLW